MRRAPSCSGVRASCMRAPRVHLRARPCAAAHESSPVSNETSAVDALAIPLVCEGLPAATEA